MKKDFMKKRRNLLKTNDVDHFELEEYIKRAHAFKKGDSDHDSDLEGKTLVLYFEKKSTRTRLSAFTAWTKLGGSVIDLSPDNSGSHIGKSESLYDSFRVIADMADCILARVGEHETLLEMERAINDSKRKPPLINALCDKWHPLQGLADLLTICETVGIDLLTNGSIKSLDVTVTWIGDANNVMNELVSLLPRFGCKMRICTPRAFPPSYEILTNSRVELFTHDPQLALKGANFVVTDTWVSMGDEDEKEMRLKEFSPYRVDTHLIDSVGNDLPADWKFMHCLPRKPEEVSDDIFYGEHSLVFEEAENRMWTILAIFWKDL